MLMIRWVYPLKVPAKKSKNEVSVRKKWSNIEKGGSKNIYSGLNGFGSNSNGLVLWENDAMGVRTLFLKVNWPPGA